MAEEKELTEEAKKQRRKREKAAAKDAALGVEKFTVEVAGVFKPDLKAVMKAHGINNQQDIHQRLLKNLIQADFETQARMLQCVTTPYEPSARVLRQFRTATREYLTQHPGESEDEVIEPSSITPL
jgi:hypothetical protein